MTKSFTTYAAAAAAMVLLCISPAVARTFLIGPNSFGTRPIGVSQDYEFYVFTRDSGEISFPGPDIQITGDHPQDFEVIELDTSPLPADDRRYGIIRFTPSGEGVRTATLSIATSDPDDPVVTDFLQGTGEFEVSDIVVTPEPDPFFFQTAQPFESGSTTQSIIVENTGNVPLQFQSDGISIIDPQLSNIYAGFTLDPVPDLSPLDPGTTRSISVKFDPDNFGEFNAGILFESNDPDTPEVEVIARGRGVPSIFTEPGPIIAANPDTFDMGVLNNLNFSRSISGTLTNLGQNNLNLDSTDSVVITPSDSPFVFGPSFDGLVLGPGSYRDFNINFEPEEFGTYEATITFNSDATSGPLEISVSAKAELLPGEMPPFQDIFFSDTEIGASSPEFKERFSSSNSGILVIENFEIIGPNSSDFILSTPLTDSYIESFESAEFGITFSPTTTGFRNAQLQIISNDTDETTTTIALRGEGTKEGPDVDLNIDDVDLGIAYRNGVFPNSLNIAIYNRGNAPLLLNSVEMAEGSDSGWNIEFFDNDITQPVPVNGFYEFQLQYQNTFNGNYGLKETHVVITSNDLESPDTLPVKVEYKDAQPVVAYDPVSANFDGVFAAPGSTESLAFNFTNFGSEPLILQSYSITGEQASDFSFDAFTPSSGVPPYQGVVYNITFKPSAIGRRTALLTLMTNDPDNLKIEIPLQGQGIEPEGDLFYYPEDEILFGSTLVNEPSTPRYVYVKNQGVLPLFFTGDQVELSGGPEFSLSDDLDLSPISPGEIRPIRIDYTPSNLSQHFAVLNVTTSDPETPSFSLNISGEGISTIPVKSYDSNGPGISTVGPGGIYSSLEEVQDAIFLSDLTGGDWTFLITGDLVEESAFELYAPELHSFIFRPDTGTSPTITFNNFDLGGNFYITPEGSVPAGNVYIYGNSDPEENTRDMTIRNAVDTNSRDLITIQDQIFNVHLENLNIEANNLTFGSSFNRFAIQIYSFERSSPPLLTNYPVDVLIKNCFIKSDLSDNSSLVDISCNKNGPTILYPDDGPQGIVFEDNEMISSANGFIVRGVKSLKLKNNRIRVQRKTGGFLTAAFVSTGEDLINYAKLEFTGNEFDNVSMPQENGSVQLNALLFDGLGDEHVYHLENNMINGVQLTSTGNASALRGVGILGPDEATFNLYHNTINVLPGAGDYTGLNSTNCYAVGSSTITSATLNLKNNILRNGQENGTALLFEGGGSELNAEYNMLWADNGPVARIAGTDYETLSALSVAYPEYTMGTSSYDPNLPMDGTASRFVAGNVLPADTHLSRLAPESLTAPVLQAITDDFDGEERPIAPNMVTMGADEPIFDSNGQPPIVIEDLAPNDGDGNNDGIPDSEQPNVLSFPSPKNGKYITIEADQGAIEDFQIMTDSELPALPANINPSYGILSYRITGIAPGSTVNLEFTFEGNPAFNSFYKYGPELSNTSDHWYDFVHPQGPGASFSAGSLTLQLIDGARGDDDLTENGIIIDPSAPGIQSVDRSSWSLY